MEFYTIGEVLDNRGGPGPTNPETVEAESDCEIALRKMIEKDFSQIPVEKDGRVVGVITPKSLRRSVMMLDRNVRETKAETIAEEPARFVSQDEDIYDLFEIFATENYVLVGNEKNLIGIITHYDIFYFVKEKIEPFLLIGDVERKIRSVVQRNYGDAVDEKISETFDGRSLDEPDGIDMFNFEQYKAFININWGDLGEEFPEEKDFIGKMLNEVQDIRNAVFHFRREAGRMDKEKLRFAHDVIVSEYKEPSMPEFAKPDKPYAQIESEFIKEQIKKRDFDNESDRVYVNKLTWLERYVIEGPSSLSDSYLRHRLTTELSREFDEIQKELKPEQYRKRKEKDEREQSVGDEVDVSELREEWEAAVEDF